MKIFDWIIVGGGIAGISLSEILTREGHSVALIEKVSANLAPKAVTDTVADASPALTT